MKLSTLQSLHDRGETMDESSFSQNGMDPDRLKQLLKNGACNCKSRCSVPYKLLLKICQCFWALPKQNQDALLWSLQAGEVDERFGRLKVWCFKFVQMCLVFFNVKCVFFGQFVFAFNTIPTTQGYQVCRLAWLRLLGIGKQRMQRTGKRFRGIDDRGLANSHLI